MLLNGGNSEAFGALVMFDLESADDHFLIGAKFVQAPKQKTFSSSDILCSANEIDKYRCR